MGNDKRLFFRICLRSFHGIAWPLIINVYLGWKPSTTMVKCECDHKAAWGTKWTFESGSTASGEENAMSRKYANFFTLSRKTRQWPSQTWLVSKTA